MRIYVQPLSLRGNSLKSCLRRLFPEPASLKFYLGFFFYFREVELRYRFSRATQLGLVKETLKLILHDLLRKPVSTLLFMLFVLEYKNMNPIITHLISANDKCSAWISRQAILGGIPVDSIDERIDYNFERRIRETCFRIWSTDLSSQSVSVNSIFESSQEIHELENTIDLDSIESKLWLDQVTDCNVYSGKFVVHQNNIVFLDHTQRNLSISWPCDIPFRFKGVLRASNTQEQVLIDEALFVGFSESWYHFLVEYLPRYLNIPSPLRRVPIILPVVQNRQLLEVLKKAGFTNFLFLKSLQKVSVKNLHIVRDFRFSDPFDFYSRKEDLELLQSFFKSLSKAVTPTVGAERVLLLRKQSSFRIMSNQSILQLSLQKRGFKCIYPEDLSFEQQLHLLQGAKVIVGQSGAALTSLLFAHSGTKVFELGNWDRKSQEYFWRNFSSALGIDLYSICALPKGIGERVYDRFRCNIVELELLLDECNFKGLE